MIGRVGGCDFGGRPIDLHLAAFRALGAKVEEGEDRITVTSPPEGLHGGRISFPIASVGATLNAVLAGVGALGVTEISGAAMEPHVVDTWRFLRKCGADIRWDDRGNIYVTGGKTLHGCCHTLVSDMIEAGTFLAAVGACSGEVELAGANVEELALPIHVLRVMGMEVEKTAAGLIGRCRRALQGCDITTAPYPGFPTDLQPQFAVLLALSKGGGRMTEGVWTNRFRYLDSLSQMGVHSLRQGSTVSFAGQDRLCGSELFSPDLRGGAALLLAALAAEGVTLLHDRGTLARGYERLDKKLRALGADLDLTMSAISPCTPPFAWHTSEQGKQGNGRVK